MGRERLAHEYLRDNARTVADVMVSPVLTATPGTPVRSVADMLERHRIKRLPVVTDGRVIGIVSRANLLRALARGELAGRSQPAANDAELRRAVLARIAAEPWARVSRVNVTVADGAVRLTGLVDSIAEKNALRLAAELTEGVKSVEDATLVRELAGV